MSKASKRAFRLMKAKIEKSKSIAEVEKQNMQYNSKPLDLTVSTPPSNIRWGTNK